MKAGAALAARHRKGGVVLAFFVGALCFAVLSLATLLFAIFDQTSGYVLASYVNPPGNVLAPGESLEMLDTGRLAEIVKENLGARRVRALEREKPLSGRDAQELRALVTEEVLVPEIARTWNLLSSMTGKAKIMAEAEAIAAENPDLAYELKFKFWLNPGFISGSQSPDALFTGARSAIIGSLLTILLTILFAFPVGIGAAIWLEEYAADNKLTRFIQTNIYNLAGVPSIIYGMLGLAIFVRALEPLTSGSLFGLGGGQVGGRSILSASLTLAILILPILIINAQEAIKAVPRGLRESSYALGASKLRTIWSHVLPASMDRILTGTVIAISRAIGETAPLVLVGAATYLTRDPDSLFSRFTTLPIQIYQWTARPQAEFRNVAASAIVVLLGLLLSLNAGAILLRDRFRSAKR